MVSKLNRIVPPSHFKSIFVNEPVVHFLAALIVGITQKNPLEGKQVVGLVNVILTSILSILS